MKKIALAYCLDNVLPAEAIAQGLEAGNIAVQHFTCKRASDEDPLAVQLNAFDGPILLVISDNFLRSISCMNSALNLLQQRHADILPVVIDGYQHDDSTGAQIAIPTRFEKIGDIIPYINYWQNQYLDLRSQRRRLDLEGDFDKDALNDHIRILRQVSAEASEFLRLLRNTPHVDAAKLQENDFEYLFTFLEDQEGWETFRANRAEPKEPVQTTPLHVVEIPAGVVKDTTQEHLEQATASTETDSPASPVQEAEQEQSGEVPYTFTPHGIIELEPENPDSTPISGAIEDHTVFSDETPGMQPPLVEPEQQEEEQIEQPSVVVHAPIEPTHPIDETIPPVEDQGPQITEPSSEPAPPDQIIEGLLTHAIQLAQSGHYDDSLAAFEAGLQEYPEAQSLRYHYALQLAQDNENFPEAVEQLNTLLAAHPNDEQANLLLGEIMEIQGNLTEARNRYAKVAQINPDFQDIYYRLALCQLKPNGDKAEAAHLFKLACKRNPAHIDAHYQYALLAADVLDKPEKALKYFEKTLALAQDHPFANYDLALLHFKEKHFSKARKYYLRAAEINPEVKTPENDLVFGVTLPPQPTTDAPHSTNEQEETDNMIATLKENIAQLEKLIQTRKSLPLPPETFRFTGKTILITGATSGIGRATALLFAQHGHRLILTGRRADKLEALCDHITEQFQTHTLPLLFDIRDQAAVSQAIANLPAEWKEIDVLINNAGKAKGFDPIQEGKLEHWEEMIDTNIKGLLYITREIAPLMVSRQSGHIINLASIAGKFIYPNGNVYCASKAAVDALTQGMRQDLFKYNIRVSQLAPGHVEETEFALVRFDGDAERAKIYEDFQPLTAGDVADTIYYIASRPTHVNIQDVVLYGTQQASATLINRSGRDTFKIL